MRPINPRNKERILEQAIPLFSERGYAAVSMRNIAAKVGISAAALYYHFPDKHTLYLEAMTHAFADKFETLTEALKTGDPAPKRLSRFIYLFTELMHEHPDVWKLIQRELLDGDEDRLELLAEHIFNTQFQVLTDLIKDLSPTQNTSLFAISLIGLVTYHFESISLQSKLPGWKEEYGEPKVIADHILKLLLDQIGEM